MAEIFEMDVKTGESRILGEEDLGEGDQKWITDLARTSRGVLLHVVDERDGEGKVYGEYRPKQKRIERFEIGNVWSGGSSWSGRHILRERPDAWTMWAVRDFEHQEASIVGLCGAQGGDFFKGVTCPVVSSVHERVLGYDVQEGALLVWSLYGALLERITCVCEGELEVIHISTQQRVALLCTTKRVYQVMFG